MGFLQSMSLWKKVVMWIICVPLVPFFCFIYIVSPNSKVSPKISVTKYTLNKSIESIDTSRGGEKCRTQCVDTCNCQRLRTAVGETVRKTNTNEAVVDIKHSRAFQSDKTTIV